VATIHYLEDGSMSPDGIGEDLARAAWLRYGKAIILNKEIYAKAISGATKKGGADARKAFDRHLARIAADAPAIIRPKLPKKRKLQRRPQVELP
jgi:hypothetical protein